MDLLEDKATGALAGAAVGDALGGAAEGNTPEAIQERYDGFIEGIVPPFLADWKNARPIAPYHKGDGHITDDTLMTTALVDVYDTVRTHLDAYSVADHLVPLLIGEKRWIPELEAENILLQRIFLAEKWLVARIHYGHIDPREAGVGNIVNCGATMYAAPIGIANAGSPDGAYAEAIDVAGAHQSSYGREAAGVYAACVAEAMRPGATVDDVIETALRLAKDGTWDAIDAVVTAASGALGDAGGFATDGWRTSLALLRRAVEPYDTVGPNYRAPARDARIPSRTKSIEELPIALGMLVLAGGDYRDSVLGSINYGRDSDSIAVMAGSIAGALGGASVVPTEWIEGVSEGSAIDITATGPRMARIAREIWAKDRERFEAQQSAVDALAADVAADPARREREHA
jgi:ADP-ribosylglycohydrolase